MNNESSGSLYARIKRNFLHLLKGRGASALLGLATIAIMTRAMHPDEFGAVIVIHTYMLTLIGLVNLKPFEAIIRYGVSSLEQGEDKPVRQLFRITLVLDLISTFIAVVLALALIPLLAPAFQWDSHERNLAMAYCLIMLTSVTGTASGILRLFNRFDLMGMRQAIAPLVQLIGIALVWWLDGGMGWYLFAFGLDWLVQNILIIYFAHRVSRQHLPGPIWRGSLWHDQARHFPGLWRFLNVVYWQSNLDLVPKRVVVLGVGALLGPAAAGLFRLAQQFSKALTVPALLLRQVLFPDMVRLWHHRDFRFEALLKRLFWSSLGLGMGVSLLALVIGKPLIGLVAGDEYLGATVILFWLMASAGMEFGVAGLRAAGYAMGLAGKLLRIYGFSLLVYGALFVVLGFYLELTGVGIATAVWSVMNLALVQRAIRKRLRAD